MQSIRAVLFDFHTTLVDGGDPLIWITQAALNCGIEPPAQADDLAYFLAHVWEHAQEIDPESSRDLSPANHRHVYELVMSRARADLKMDIGDEFATEMYRTMADYWRAYADARPVLACLRDAGVRLALISNIGIELHPILEREGLAEFFDEVVLSLHVGAVKPQPEIFEYAMRALGVAPRECLMVGDSAIADAGAANLGIRTLLLPRTQGPIHGLAAVCRLLGLEFDETAAVADA